MRWSRSVPFDGAGPGRTGSCGDRAAGAVPDGRGSCPVSRGGTANRFRGRPRLAIIRNVLLTGPATRLRLAARARRRDRDVSSPERRWAAPSPPSCCTGSSPAVPRTCRAPTSCSRRHSPSWRPWSSPTSGATLLGWLLLSTALMGPYVLAGQYAAFALHSGGSTPVPTAAAWLSIWGYVPYLVLWGLVPMHVPDGRLSSPRWRTVRRVTVGLIAVETAGPDARARRLRRRPRAAQPTRAARGRVARRHHPGDVVRRRLRGGPARASRRSGRGCGGRPAPNGRSCSG